MHTISTLPVYSISIPFDMFLLLADGMFLNYHGQYCARLNRDQSVQPGSTKEKRLSAFFCLVSPILFYMPDSYMKKLDMVWVDDTLNHYRWKEFITRMRAEWERYNTPVSAGFRVLEKNPIERFTGIV